MYKMYMYTDCFYPSLSNCYVLFRSKTDPWALGFACDNSYSESCYKIAKSQVEILTNYEVIIVP